MGAVEKDALFILYIMSITQVTSRGGIVSPGHIFLFVEVGTKSEASHAANTSRGRSRSTYLGRVYGKCVTRALLVGRAHH